MRKVATVTAAFVLCAAGLFAGGGSQQQGASGGGAQAAPVEITFWDGNPGPDRTPYLEQIIGWYQEAQNKVKVKYVGVPQAQIIDKLNVAIAGNAVPDVTEMRASWAGGFIAQKALYKLDDMLNTWQDGKQFDTKAIQAVRDLDLNGGLYLLPVRATYQCMWYRVDRFKEKGLGVPQTWDEFFSAVEKMTDLSKNQYGFSIRGGAGSASQIQILMFAYSGIKDYIDPQTGKAAFRDPAMLQFLTRFAGIYKKNTAAGDVNNTYQAMVAAFDSGVANIISHNLGSLGEHQKSLPAGTFGTFIFPKSMKGYYNLIEPTYAGYGVCENTKVKNEAVNFLQWLGSERVISFWNQTIGEFPTRYDVQKHEWVQQADHLKNIVPVAQDPETFIAKTANYLPEYQRILLEIGEPGFQAVLLGQKTPAQYLDEWSAALEQAYQRYLANKK
jgi:multiple sugar transport system substrate-binding protein